MKKDELVKAGLDLARHPDWSDSFLRHAWTCTSQYDASHRKLYAHVLALHQWVIEAARVLDAPPAPSGWQPIESAPKDEGSVMLYGEGFGYRAWMCGYFKSFSDGSSGWITSVIYTEPQDTWRGSGPTPTHWAPIPRPPQTTREFTIRICNDCYTLKGEMCHQPDCVFCRRTMAEVGEMLDALLIRPVVDGERLDLHSLTAADASPVKEER